MIEKCANPACSASFRNLRDGRVFVMEVDDSSHSDGNQRSRKLRYSWLCNACCRTMTVVAENGEIKIAQRAAPSAVPQTAA